MDTNMTSHRTITIFYVLLKYSKIVIKYVMVVKWAISNKYTIDSLVFGLTDSYVITFISDMYHLCLDSAGIVDGRYYDAI